MYNTYGQVIDENYYCDNIDTLPDNPLRFQGQYYDEEMGLHYNYNRYYDPFVGRYITQDPLGILGGINAYQYCQNPINRIDPLGLFNVNQNGFEALAGKSKAGAIQVGNATSELLALPSGKQDLVIRNELLDHEYKQALDIVGYKGGTFKGATKKNQEGIDGWLNGVPVQLKEVQGQSIHSIRKNIVGGANDMAKAGYKGDLYIDASKTGVNMNEMINHFKPGSPVSNITKEGTVNNIYIKT